MNEVLENSMPKGWRVGTVGETGEYINGLAFKPEDWHEEGMPIIRIQNLTNPDKPFNVTTREVDELYIVNPGDILVSWSATLDAFVWHRDPAILNQHIFKVVPNTEVVNERFLFYMLKRAIAEMIQSEHLHGSTMKHINRKPFLAHQVPIPPMEQQKRIVAKIEDLFSHIDAGIEALKKAKQLLKQYRQSVLKAAVTGELTKEWREVNKDKLDPASKLLERILTERRQKWEEQQLEQFKAKGLPAPKKGVWWLYVLLCDDNSFYIGVTEDMPRRWKEHTSGQGAEYTKKHKPESIIHHEEFKSQKEAYNREKVLKTGFGRKWLKREYEKATLRQAGKIPKDDKWKEKYKEPEGAPVDDLPAIPNEWVWATLPQLGELNRGKSKHRPRNDPSLYGGDYPFVQTGDVRAANTWLKKFSQTYSDKGLAQSRLWPKGTMCITIAANIADTAILEFDACFPDSVVGFIPLNDSVNVEVVEFFIRTVKSDLEKYAPATAQKNINLAILETVAIPLMPVNEQEELINSLKYKISMADRLEEEIDRQLIKIEKSKQSVLATAFNGKLNYAA